MLDDDVQMNVYSTHTRRKLRPSSWSSGPTSDSRKSTSRARPGLRRLQFPIRDKFRSVRRMTPDELQHALGLGDAPRPFGTYVALLLCFAGGYADASWLAVIPLSLLVLTSEYMRLWITLRRLPAMLPLIFTSLLFGSLLFGLGRIAAHFFPAESLIT